MLTKSILKIWLLSVNFEKFISINLWTDQSQSSVWSAVVIGFNSRREFNHYHKTSILFIIEELWAWFKVTSFALITWSSPFWSFYAPETANASGTNKIVQAQKWSKRETEVADCTKDGLPVMLFVNPLFGKIICENI